MHIASMIYVYEFLCTTWCHISDILVTINEEEDGCFMCALNRVFNIYRYNFFIYQYFYLFFFVVLKVHNIVYHLLVTCLHND